MKTYKYDWNLTNAPMVLFYVLLVTSCRFQIKGPTVCCFDFSHWDRKHFVKTFFFFFNVLQNHPFPASFYTKAWETVMAVQIRESKYRASAVKTMALKTNPVWLSWLPLGRLPFHSLPLGLLVLLSCWPFRACRHSWAPHTSQGPRGQLPGGGTRASKVRKAWPSRWGFRNEFGAMFVFLGFSLPLPLLCFFCFLCTLVWTVHFIPT